MGLYQRNTILMSKESRTVKEEVELVIDSKCLLGEGPWWDNETGRLYWIDSFAYKLFIYDPVSKENKEHFIGQEIGCAIPCRNGKVLLALRDGLFIFDLDSGSLEELSDIEREVSNNRLNDGKCDSKGRIWFGSMSMTANQENRDFEIAGSFYKFENGKVIRQFGDVGISNGIAWNMQETMMFYVDTITKGISAFDFDVTSGTISNRRTVIKIEPNDGVPDGICIDAEGMVWVAHFSGGQVSRWNPKTGEMLERIYLPAINVTSCCFGGADLSDLYITTARTGLSQKQIEAFPYTGGLFRIRPGVKGTVLNKFFNQSD